MTDFQSSIQTSYIGKKLIHFSSIESTNSYLLNDYQGTYEEGLVVIADQQTAGRGRFLRKWHSAYKQSLLFSVLLCPRAEAQLIPQLTQVACLAVVKALENVCLIKPRIKWPNDVFIDDKKCCGILSEMKQKINQNNAKSGYYAVIGIGLNINQRKEDFPEEVRDKATSLLLETDREWARELLLAQILAEIEYYYERWKKDLFNKIIEEIKNRFYLTGRYIQVQFSENHIITGQAVGLNPQGFLLIEDQNGDIQTIFSGEVII